MYTLGFWTWALLSKDVRSLAEVAAAAMSAHDLKLLIHDMY
jgi:hypothetical protein